MSHTICLSVCCKFVPPPQDRARLVDSFVCSGNPLLNTTAVSGPTDTQLRGVKMHTPSTGRTPQEIRLIGVKTQSAGTHPFGDPLDTELHSMPLLCNQGRI